MKRYFNENHIMKLLGRALQMLAVFLLFSGCTDDQPCEEATANRLRVGFYIAGQETETIASVNSFSVYALDETARYLIYDNQNNVSVVELPLNPLENQCAFVLSFGESRDTIWFQYAREEHLISIECGFTLFFDIAEVDYTTHFLEALVINNTYVTNSFDEHIKVYFPDPGIIIN